MMEKFKNIEKTLEILIILFTTFACFCLLVLIPTMIVFNKFIQLFM